MDWVDNVTARAATPWALGDPERLRHHMDRAVLAGTMGHTPSAAGGGSGNRCQGLQRPENAAVRETRWTHSEPMQNGMGRATDSRSSQHITPGV
jgi:hypothetical protein